MSKRIETIESTRMCRREQLRLLALGHRYQFVGAMLVAVGGVANCTFVQQERVFTTRGEAEAHAASFTEADAVSASVAVYGPAKFVGSRVETRLAHNTL